MGSYITIILIFHDSFKMTDLKLTATTFYGLENVLADELNRLGAKNIQKTNRAVSFEGDLGFLYKVNYNIHTALRILWQIRTAGNIYKAQQLYGEISKIDWSEYMSANQTLRIDVTGQTKYFKNTRFIALKAKDAIVDQFRAKFNKRPDINLKNPDIRIILHFQDQKLSVLLDSSGESLHKRGYRTQTNMAPLNEVLASGITALSSWEGNRNLLDPMCGSGTILIEAAMWQMQIPASINRQKFTFQNWQNYNPELFELIKEGSLNKIKELPTGIKLTGYDKAPSAVAKARQNIRNANLEEFISIKQADFFRTFRPKHDTMLLFNPPYNERISIDTKQFYKRIGDTLKHHYPDTEAWLLVGNLQAIKFVGLRPSKRIKLFNGKIESRLVQYQLYEGSKRLIKQ